MSRCRLLSRRYRQHRPKLRRPSTARVGVEVPKEGFEPSFPGSEPGVLPLDDLGEEEARMRFRTDPRLSRPVQPFCAPSRYTRQDSNLQ